MQAMRTRRRPTPHHAGPPQHTLQDEAPNGSFQIFCRNLCGKTSTIYVTPLCMVWQVKEMICHQLGIPREEMRLIWSGMQLDDAQTIADLKITRECTLHLMLRLKGD